MRPERIFHVFLGAVLLFGATGCYAWPYNTRPHSYFAALGDLDGDGDLDTYLANGENEGVAKDMVWFNDGRGHFSAPAAQKYESETHFAALGDLDGDGDLDVVTSRALGFNNGKGEFRYEGHPFYLEDNGSYTLYPALGDLDGDGDLDAVIGGCCGAEISGADGPDPEKTPMYSYNMVWLNEADGLFVNSGQRLGVDGTVGVALGDLDGDGDLDVFEANASSIVRGMGEVERDQPDRVLWNDGKGNLSDSGQRLGSDEGYAVALGDLDGDEDLDAFTGGIGPALVWLNDGSGQYGGSGQRLGSQDIRRVMLSDLDGDGDLDAFCAGRGSGQTWLNDGRAHFSAGTNLEDSLWAAFALGDVDGDGDADVFSGLLNKRTRVWFNDGKGSFVESGQNPSGN